MNQVFRALAGVASSAGSSAVLNLLLGVLIARSLGPEGQGSYTTVITLIAVLPLVLNLGTGIALRLGTNNWRPTNGALTAYAVLTCIFVLISVPISLMSIWLVLPELISGGGIAVILLVSLIAASQVLARQASDLVQAFGRPAMSILAMAIGVAVQLCLYLAFMTAWQATLQAALFTSIVGSVVQISISLWVLRKEQLRWSPRNLREHSARLISTGSPTIGNNVGLALMQRTGRIVLAIIGGPIAVGFFAVAATIAEGSRILTSAAAQLLFVQASGDEAKRLMSRKTYRTMVVGGLIIAAVVLLVADPLIYVLFGQQYSGSSDILQVLVIGEFFMGLALMDSRLLIAQHDGRWTGAASLVFGILGIPLLIAGAHIASAIGVAWSSAVLFATFWVILFLRRHLQFHH